MFSHELSDGGRIKASKELLASTDYSITEVAQSSGFSSTELFCPVLSETLPYDGQRLPEGLSGQIGSGRFKTSAHTVHRSRETALRSVTLSPSLTCPTKHFAVFIHLPQIGLQSLRRMVGIAVDTAIRTGVIGADVNAFYSSRSLFAALCQA